MDKAALAVKQTLKLTVFCRADWQIKAIMRDSAWVFKQTKAQIERLSLNNLQIDYQWHPHLYSLQDNHWRFSLNEQEQALQLNEIYNDLAAQGYPIDCVRIGECFFSNSILKTLLSLGIKIDSSALPGRDLGYVDWRTVNQTPYSPNPLDYKKVGQCALLEVPFSMINILAPYEDTARQRYLNTVYQHQYTQQGIKAYPEHYITTIAHPFEVLKQANKHQLLGDQHSVFDNITAIYQSHQVQSIFLKDITFA